MTAEKTTKTSQSEDVYELLKWKILNSELVFSRLYSELELCEISGYGRSPIRSAISKLQHDRLVEVVPRKGLFIRGWNSSELQSVIEARIILETASIRLTTKNISKEQLQKLEKIIEEGRKYIKTGDRKKLMQLDHNFHMLIAKASGNEVIAELVSSLKQRSNPLWFLTVTDEDKLQSVQDEHEMIFEAIKAADPDSAEKAMNYHVEKLSNVLNQTLN